MTASAPDERIKIKRIIHVIHAIENIASCRALYLDQLGGLIFAEGYFEAEDRDMALLYVADFMMEPMAPRTPGRTDKPFARYLQSYGQGFHSFEIQVEDGKAASARLREAGCRLASDYGFFFFVKQESTGGVLLEVCDKSMPNDPWVRPNWRGDLAVGHATTLARLDHIACATNDMSSALEFFTGLLDGEVISDQRLRDPQPGRRVMLRLAETNVAFFQPDDPNSGPIGAFLTPPASGIYAMVWQVENLETARSALLSKGLLLTEQDCISSGFAIAPESFLGARHEFVPSKQVQ